MTIEEKIAVIRNFVTQLRQQVGHLSPSELTTAYIEGEWTIAQNIHHLFDSHSNAYQLCKRVLSEDEAGLSWTKQDILADLPDAQRADISGSLMALEGLHSRWADMFDNIDNWDKSGKSIKSGKVYTLADLLRMYANHCENHRQQIQDVLDAMN
ncbi:MAG: hypothetical protein Phog2KO_14480 [Phototrophicaceae bacterium]